MIILGIETSCDETAIAVLKCEGDIKSPVFEVLGNVTLSQAQKHAEFGGVFPNLARREHGRNLIPVLKKTLESSFAPKTFAKPKVQGQRISKSPLDKTSGQATGNFPLDKTSGQAISKQTTEEVEEILKKEPELLKQFLEFIPTIKKPNIDAIAVTTGPGLEPALWVGIVFAKALGLVWNIPVIPTNHMMGHIVSVLLNGNEISNVKGQISNEFGISKAKELKPKSVSFPILSLLISGGHTELVLSKSWTEHKKIGQTVDDAVGEAFDKVARILGLSYPGGPQIARLASEARTNNKQLITNNLKLPRPMLHSKDLNFSFSGLKTAVLYMVKKIPDLTEEIKKGIAREFEDAVTEVLISKTKKALIETGAQNLIVAGGVSANQNIRENFERLAEEMGINLEIPSLELSTDNAIMIAIAGYIKSQTEENPYSTDFKAKGNLDF